MAVYYVEIAPTRGRQPVEAETARDAVRQSVTSTQTLMVRVYGPDVVTTWRASRFTQHLVSWREA